VKKIAVEEHFFTQTYVDYMRSGKGSEQLTKVKDSNGKEYELMDCVAPVPGELEWCLDVGEGRLKDME
jgi:hypothetical protein